MSEGRKRPAAGGPAHGASRGVRLHDALRSPSPAPPLTAPRNWSSHLARPQLRHAQAAHRPHSQGPGRRPRRAALGRRTGQPGVRGVPDRPAHARWRRGEYQAGRRPGAAQYLARCAGAPRLDPRKATRGPSWGGSWRSASLFCVCASCESRACAACLKNRPRNSPTASETPNHAARPTGSHHHALMSRLPRAAHHLLGRLPPAYDPLHDGPAGPSRRRVADC
jgi:hypothetical protein